MKRKEKVKRMENSSDDEDSDAERNFTLIAQRGGAEGDAEEIRDDEEEDEEKDDEEEDNDEEEEEGKGVEPEDSDTEDSNDDDDDEDEDEDDNNDEDPQATGGSSELQTRDDVKKGENLDI